MRLIVVAIKDRAVDAFMLPQFVAHVGAAVRGFSDAVNNKDSQFHGHPEDYDLFELGHFEDTTGLFEVGTPRQVAIGKDLVRA